jgi:hypothetical protein
LNTRALKQIPWSRLLFEGVVIVASILLAFAIDAWWDARQQSRAGRDLVAAVVEEAEANRELIATTIQRVETYQAGTRRFFGMTVDELRSMPPDSALRLIEDMWVPATFEFSQGALGTATTAEGARLIGDAEVWRALSTLEAQLSDFEERFRLLADASQHVLINVGAHPLLQSRFLGDRVDPPETVDVREIRSDNEVLAAASAMQQNREIYVLYLRRFSDAIDRTLELLADRTEP